MRDNFFKTIQRFCNYDKTYYTIEQPFFNRAIFTMENIDVDLFVSPKVVLDPDLYNKKYESILKNLKAKGIEIAKYY